MAHALGWLLAFLAGLCFVAARYLQTMPPQSEQNEPAGHDDARQHKEIENT